MERIFSKFLCVLFPRRVGKLFWGWNILENKGRFKRRWINHICENWRFCIPDLISWKRTMEVTWKRTSEDRLLVQTFSACARDNTGSIPNLVCILWLGKIKLRSLGYVSSPYWNFAFVIALQEVLATLFYFFVDLCALLSELNVWMASTYADDLDVR